MELLEENKPKILFPGENVPILINQISLSDGLIKCGIGLEPQGQNVFCTIPGRLKFKKPETHYIEYISKRYKSNIGDHIIGIIEDKTTDFYRVNIFDGGSSLLSRLSFEGATKRNQPDLKKGDVIYARVSFAHKHLDTELSCIPASGNKRDWSSGESIYGELKDGLFFRISLLHARSLLHRDCAVLNALGRHLKYEIAIGLNGCVWINSGNCIESIIIRNAIVNADILDVVQTEAMVDQLVQVAKAYKQQEERQKNSMDDD